VRAFCVSMAPKAPCPHTLEGILDAGGGMLPTVDTGTESFSVRLRAASFASSSISPSRRLVSFREGAAGSSSAPPLWRHVESRRAVCSRACRLRARTLARPLPALELRLLDPDLAGDRLAFAGSRCVFSSASSSCAAGAFECPGVSWWRLLCRTCCCSGFSRRRFRSARCGALVNASGGCVSIVARALLIRRCRLVCASPAAVDSRVARALLADASLCAAGRAALSVVNEDGQVRMASKR
jgi:hypothetical protein